MPIKLFGTSNTNQLHIADLPMKSNTTCLLSLMSQSSSISKMAAEYH